MSKQAAWEDQDWAADPTLYEQGQTSARFFEPGDRVTMRPDKWEVLVKYYQDHDWERYRIPADPVPVGTVTDTDDSGLVYVEWDEPHHRGFGNPWSIPGMAGQHILQKIASTPDWDEWEAKMEHNRRAIARLPVIWRDNGEVLVGGPQDHHSDAYVRFGWGGYDDFVADDSIWVDNVYVWDTPEGLLPLYDQMDGNSPLTREIADKAIEEAKQRIVEDEYLREHPISKMAAWGEDQQYTNRSGEVIRVGTPIVYINERGDEYYGVVQSINLNNETVHVLFDEQGFGEPWELNLDWEEVYPRTGDLEMWNKYDEAQWKRQAAWGEEEPTSQPTLVPKQAVWWIMNDGRVLIEGLNTEHTSGHPPIRDDYKGMGYIDKNGEPVVMSYSYKGNYWDPGYAQLGPDAKEAVRRTIFETLGLKTASPITGYQWIPLTSFELQGWDELSQRERQQWSNRAIRHNDRAHKFGISGGVTGKELWALATKRFENKCAYCDRFLAWGTKDATLDHIHSLSLGGGAGIDNIVPACLTCNHELQAWDERNNPTYDRQDYAVPHPEFGGPYIQQKDKRVMYEPRSPEELLH